MANKWRGEVPFPALGKGVYVSFPLEDLAELEDQFGEDFFDVIERATVRLSPKIVPAVLAIGVKRRDSAAVEHKIWEDVGLEAFSAGKFSLADARLPIMDAISLSWLHKPYEKLIEEAIEARKKADADNLKRAKEAAQEAGIPFDEALSEGLSRLLTAQESTLSQSGD